MEDDEVHLVIGDYTDDDEDGGGGDDDGDDLDEKDGVARPCVLLRKFVHRKKLGAILLKPKYRTYERNVDHAWDWILGEMES